MLSNKYVKNHQQCVFKVLCGHRSVYCHLLFYIRRVCTTHPLSHVYPHCCCAHWRVVMEILKEECCVCGKFYFLIICSECHDKKHMQF